MRIPYFARRTMTYGLVAAAALAGGCGANEAALEEMSQQQQEMTGEVATWRAELDKWDQEHTVMKQWHADHPGIPAGKDQEDLDAHHKKLADHEQEVAEFRRNLEEHERKLTTEVQKERSEQLAEHAGLWAEHATLKVTYERLEGAHRDVAEEHASFIGGGDTTRS